MRKKRQPAIILSIAACVFTILIIIFWANWPINPTDRDVIGGQLLATILIAGLGIWVADKKWHTWIKVVIFVVASSVSFVLWNINNKLEPISCTTDVMLFKTGSGDLISPEIFALYNDNVAWLNGELDGYNEISGIDQLQKTETKQHPQYDLQLLGAATLSWMHVKNSDWAGCKAEPMFIGLSGGSQRITCSGESKGNEIGLKDYFGLIGTNQKFFLPPGGIIRTSSGSDYLLVSLKNIYAEITFIFSSAKNREELKPHRRDDKLTTIEENIARYYRDRPQPLTANGFRINFELKKSKLFRWSKATNEYQKKAEIFCSEYDKAFSWKNLRGGLQSAFDRSQD